MANGPAPIDVDATVAALTLEEKAALLSGATFWETVAIERDGSRIPSIWVSDGPHGLRKQAEDDGDDHVGLGASVPATCFPTAVTLGSTWDIALLAEVGAALGAETRSYGVSVLLGPGANIKRDPRCGRNFEYLSEDPVLSGDLAAALIRGIQSQGVGTSLKHYAANNQENDRMRVSAEVDERTLREIYLTSFERAVTQGDPWTVMCSYNKVNGVYASQNPWLLTQVLRKEWGWDGLVVSDWGAVRDRVAAVAAGLDLEMPTSAGRGPAAVVAAVRAGELPEAAVDAAVRNVVRLVDRATRARAAHPDVAPASLFDAHHALARRAAAAGTVLLRNQEVSRPGANGTTTGRLLPLSGGDGVVVIGEFARTPRYQGAGSSQVNPTRLTNALDALAAHLGGPLPFAPGFQLDGGPVTDLSEADLLAQACDLAREAGTVLLFLGLPGEAESEGYDRTTIALPADQLALLEAVTAVNPNVVVALSNGAVVSMEWRERVPSIVEAWLGGQAGGEGIADVLTGAADPGGRLAETIPLRLQDGPSYPHFPGALSQVSYGEGIYVGYRGFDVRDAPVAYPFGFGLSYTSFEIDDVAATVSGSGAGTVVTVSARVRNTGERAGAEVVQVYVSDPVALVDRPVAELKAFSSVHLEPGESRTVTFALDSRALAYRHPLLGRWVVEGGEFLINVGRSSRDFDATVSVAVVGEDASRPLDSMSTLAEVRANPVTGPVLEPAMTNVDPGFAALLADAPLEAVLGFGVFPIDADALWAAIDRANATRP